MVYIINILYYICHHGCYVGFQHQILSNTCYIKINLVVELYVSNHCLSFNFP